MRYIATTSEKIPSINVAFGQLIFSTDDRVIYLDTDERTSFQQIITVVDEETRQNLISPVQGFYFVGDTKTLWNYKDSIWTQLTEPPKENLVFANRENFPTLGEEKVLYIDNQHIYQWNSNINDYIEVGTPTWDAIS